MYLFSEAFLSVWIFYFVGFSPLYFGVEGGPVLHMLRYKLGLRRSGSRSSRCRAPENL